MARFGTPHASGHGDPRNHVSGLRVSALMSGAAYRVRFTPATNFGDAFFHIYVNGRKAGQVYAEEGQEVTTSVTASPGQTKAHILVLRVGHYAAESYAVARVARAYQSTDSPRVTIFDDWGVQVIGAVSDQQYTSSWSLSGLTFFGMQRVDHYRTRGYLDLALSVSGSAVTVTLSRNNITVASGSGTVGGSVTLTAQNDSGISGSVTIDAGAATLSGAKVIARWPSKMEILRDQTDPPTTLVATKFFDERDQFKWTEPNDLDGGTYYYRLRPISDSGDTGDESTSLTAVIPSPPEPPTGLAYSSGNQSATVLSFVGSTTVGATYRAYIQNVGEAAMDLGTVAATAIAGATIITLPAITGGAGTARVLVRAVFGGVEEKNWNAIDLEYDGGGTYLAPRPNSPSIVPESIDVTSGLTLAVDGLYDNTDEEATPDRLQLFTRTPSGSYNFNIADDTQNLAASVSGTNLKKASLSHTFSAAGFYYITLKAITAGGVQCATEATEFYVYVDDANISAPTPTLYVSRG